MTGSTLGLALVLLIVLGSLWFILDGFLRLFWIPPDPPEPVPPPGLLEDVSSDHDRDS